MSLTKRVCLKVSKKLFSEKVCSQWEPFRCAKFRTQRLGFEEFSCSNIDRVRLRLAVSFAEQSLETLSADASLQIFFFQIFFLKSFLIRNFRIHRRCALSRNSVNSCVEGYHTVFLEEDTRRFLHSLKTMWDCVCKTVYNGYTITLNESNDEC